MDFDVGWHCLVEFKKEVDCSPKADVGEVELFLQLVKADVNVGYKEDYLNGND